MNGTQGNAPKPIEATRLLLGEGREEELFMEALLKHLGLAGILIEQYGGKNNLAPFLRALRNRSGFAQVQRIGILRDADDDPAAALASLDGAIAQAGFSASVAVAKLLLPGGNQIGALENLCLQSIAGQPISTCIEDYMTCAAQATGHAHTTTSNKSKARVHAWLASQAEPDLRLGHAAAKGWIDWSSPAFDGLKEFVRSVA